MVRLRPTFCIGGSFQDYFWIQDFEAVPTESRLEDTVRIKQILADFLLLSNILMTIDHLNLELILFWRHTASFKIGMS